MWQREVKSLLVSSEDRWNGVLQSSRHAPRNALDAQLGLVPGAKRSSATRLDAIDATPHEQRLLSLIGKSLFSQFVIHRISKATGICAVFSGRCSVVVGTNLRETVAG
eukprot:2888249-Pleurochrysis_carterae.AAC.19